MKPTLAPGAGHHQSLVFKRTDLDGELTLGTAAELIRINLTRKSHLGLPSNNYIVQ